MKSGAPIEYMASVAVALGGAAIVAASVYLVLRHSITIVAKLGTTGELVLQQVMAFVLVCIGLQLMWNGWIELA